MTEPSAHDPNLPPSDQIARHEPVEAEATVPDERTGASAPSGTNASASSESGAPSESRAPSESGAASFTPAPAPQSEWARAAWSREAAERQTPERWFEPGVSAGGASPVGPDERPAFGSGWTGRAAGTQPAQPIQPIQPIQPTEPVQPVRPVRPVVAPPTIGHVPPAPTTAVRRDSRWAGPGAVLGAALLAAVLASGGTFLALDASGALDRAAAPAPSASNGTNGTGTPTSLQQPLSIVESSAVVDAAAKTGPAVVRITATGTNVDLAGGRIPSTGIGSGVIYDAAGWILTNRHVVTNTNGQLVNSLKVELEDGRSFDGTIYGVDTLTDLAIVRIQGSNLVAAPIGTSANLKVGQLAIAIGSPLGTFSNSVTSGIVSATGRSITVENERLSNLIQTDAAINPGNSGGPLLDAGGNVIGINTAIASDSNGIGFAIPIDIARPIMQQALAGQQLSRPYLGIRYLAIDPQVQQQQGLPVDKGAYVGSGTGADSPVVAGGPAAAAGLKEGDIIVAIGETEIDREHPLDLVLSGYAPGQTVAVKILRDGKEQTLNVTLGTRPAGL